ncbi:MAG TPA: type VI secretion system-associated protein TagF, partial [Burkholderiaceae bacterium]|nr:type VI secretion system-associated protein TagF [Burkholderiaceae bacterium]
MSSLPMRIDAPGWYGKLGALGDFASRRLPPGMVQACDHWLARMLADSQALLGERWLGAYLRAPLWRTAWAPGVLDEQWWFGALMPSCDAVGRYFPLLVLQPRRAAPQDRIALDHLELWWQALGRAMLHTLSEGVALAAFEDALAELPPWPTARPFAGDAPTLWPGRAGGMAAGSLPARLALPDFLPWPVRVGLSQGLGGLAAQCLIDGLADCSVWWPLLLPEAADAAPGVHRLVGLPDGAAFARLMGEGPSPGA